MENIVFGGCSMMWGQSLWYHGNFENDNHPRDGMYYGNMVCPECKKYSEDNRFATQVAKYFGLKPKVKAINGGSNLESIEYCKKAIDKDTKLVIIQTTQFVRNNIKIDEQIEKFEEFVLETEEKNIPVRFIHWVWPNVTEEELKIVKQKRKNPFNKRILIPSFESTIRKDGFDSVIPPIDSNKLASKIIKDRTIFILNKFNFFDIIEWDYSKNGNELNRKYTIAGKFGISKIPDTHLNLDGHNLFAKEIINYIENKKLL